MSGVLPDCLQYCGQALFLQQTYLMQRVYAHTRMSKPACGLRHLQREEYYVYVYIKE